MRTCLLSKIFRNHSKALMPFGTVVKTAGSAPASMRRLTASIVALTRDPPVALMADMASLPVSMTASLKVALPLRYAAAVSVMAPVLGVHRGSNQSALKSNIEKTRTNSRMLQ
jgi:hypothetical protein